MRRAGTAVRSLADQAARRREELAQRLDLLLREGAPRRRVPCRSVALCIRASRLGPRLEGGNGCAPRTRATPHSPDRPGNFPGNWTRGAIKILVLTKTYVLDETDPGSTIFGSFMEPHLSRRRVPQGLGAFFLCRPTAGSSIGAQGERRCCIWRPGHGPGSPHQIGETLDRSVRGHRGGRRWGTRCSFTSRSRGPGPAGVDLAFSKTGFNAAGRLRDLGMHPTRDSSHGSSSSAPYT